MLIGTGTSLQDGGITWTVNGMSLISVTYLTNISRDY